MWVALLKLALVAALIAFLLPLGALLVHYLVGQLLYGWNSGVLHRVEQLNAGNFSKQALMDITPPPLDPNHVSIGEKRPYFLFLRINRGENPQAPDPRFFWDREQVKLTVYQGFGVLKPLAEKRDFWDTFNLMHDRTFTVDEHGQVLAVFYPSPFARTILGRYFTKSIGPQIVIAAQVLDNPKITNEVAYEWTPVDLDPSDFDRAVDAFVGWHNHIRRIDRTEVGKEVSSFVDPATGQFNKALGIPKPSDQPVATTTYQGGQGISNGQEFPNEEYSYDYFFERTGREPWGYMGKNVVFISHEFTRSVDLWTYDPATGLMKEKLRYPSPSGLGAQEDLCEYQQINGHYFHADDLFLDYYGQVITYRDEIRTTVTLAH